MYGAIAEQHSESDQSQDVVGGHRFESRAALEQRDDQATNETILANPKVLIVTHTQAAVDELSRRLSGSGFSQILTTDDGIEAIDIIRREGSHLVLMESELAGRLLVLTTFRSDDTLCHCPVLTFEVNSGATSSFCVTDVQSESSAWNHHISRVKDAIACAPVETRSTGERPKDAESNPLALREPRYTVLDGASLDSAIDIEIEGESYHLPVRLMDVSCHGAKFNTVSPPTPGALVTLHVKAPNTEINLTVRGEVRWCEPWSEKECRIGCFFPEEIQGDVLQQLAGAGFLERRSGQRNRAVLRVTVREQLTTGESEPGEIIEYSSDGLRLNTASPKTIGQRLLVQLYRRNRESNSVPVRAVWQREVEDGFEVGCCFISKSGNELIQRSELTSESRSDSDTSSQTTGANSSLRLSGIWWVGLVAIMALGFLGAIVAFEFVYCWWHDALTNHQELMEIPIRWR